MVFFVWISVLAVTCTYIFPELGISILIIAIVLNFIQRICEKFKEGRKHESIDHMASKAVSYYPHNFTGQMVEDLEWVLSQINMD